LPDAYAPVERINRDAVSGATEPALRAPLPT
jgi:hypothetical protein